MIMHYFTNSLWKKDDSGIYPSVLVTKLSILNTFSVVINNEVNMKFKMAPMTVAKRATITDNAV